jgi:16S rRNA (adenine1518-N6/adenine1519-N6)-dimethyltransferase
MIEPSIFQMMSACASLSKNDVVLDIGAGLGFLTRFLAGRCKNVLAVESDAGLVEALREQLGDLSNVKIIKGNVLEVQFPHFNKVVAIPPYNISSRLLQWLFDTSFDWAVLIFQKEFAGRLVASIGSEDYGWLTVVTYYHMEVELLDDVPKWTFYPQPEVDSVITRLKPRKPPPFTVRNGVLFKRLVQSLFTQRNRKVRNAVFSFVRGTAVVKTESAAKVSEAVPFLDKRVRELAPEDFGALANALTE